MADITVGLLKGDYRTANGVSGEPTRRLRLSYFFPYFFIGFSGLYKIQGVARMNGVAAANITVLLAPASTPSVIIGDKKTGADGTFLFDGIATGRYTVVGYDLSQVYNGVMKANVLSVVR